MPDRELRLLQFLGHRLPRMPHASGIANRILKPWYLRKRRARVVCDVLGLRMELDPRESVDGNLIFCPQLYDRIEIAYLLDHLGPDDTFVDIGAHVGFYALRATTRIRTGRVLAIEAAPETYATLQRNIRMNDANVTAVHCGVSDRVETLKLHLQETGNRGGNSFLLRQGLGEYGVEVPCYPLVEILRRNEVERVTGMKIDVEGFEHKILKAFFDQAPAPLRPRFVITEFHPWLLGGAETTGDQIALLESLGYREVRRAAYNRIFSVDGSSAT
ncbi:MAG: hypothetical protein DMD62_04835 [Gemmatimonadetes bacterium]|nr:MAG: hypothetical protein DMD62_04835 [Gemmatimonadota bacterium]